MIECRVAAPAYVQLYQFLAIIVGVVGNSFVIYASKQYSTFNLDSNTIFLVRHLGYADVAILILGFLPANFLFVGELNTSGAFSIICTIQGICMNIFGLSALSITAGISIHRLLRCTQPQVIARLRRNVLLAMVSGCYLGAGFVAILVMVLPPKLEYRSDNGYYSCIGHYNVNREENSSASSLQHTMASISLGVGMTLSGLFFVIIILINILLHHFSKKKLGQHKGSSSKKHRTSRYRTLTTHSISALLVMTWLPFASTFFVIITQENTHPSTMECQSNTILRTVSTFVVNFYLLNFVLNPFLYCITNINFMKFVIKLIKRTCNDKMCAALWSRINADLDISTNVSTLDHGLERSNSNNCNAQGDAGEKVYSNTLTVPDAAARKKLAGARSAESPHGSYTHELEGNTANKIVITVCESNQEEANVVKCEKEHYSKTAKKGPGKKGWSVKLRSKKKDKTCSASSKSKKSENKTGDMPVVTVETDDHRISPQTSNQINESTGAELSCQTI